MKIILTFGETTSRADAAIKQLEQRGAVNTAKVDTTVRTILDHSLVRDVIPKLKAAGGTGIVEYPLSKVVL